MRKKQNKQKREKCANPILFSYFPVLSMQIKFWLRLSVNLETSLWSWQQRYSRYRQEVILRVGPIPASFIYWTTRPQSSTHWCLPGKHSILTQRKPQSQGVKHSYQKMTLVVPEAAHRPSFKLFPKHPTHRAPTLCSPLCNTSLSREIYYRAVNTILPLRKKIKIRNTLQEDVVAKAKS